jgi:hypothetical protein
MENSTYEGLCNDEAVTPGVTLVNLVILTEDDSPDLNEILVTWGSPGHQHAGSFQCEGNDLVLEMILGALGEVII